MERTAKAQAVVMGLVKSQMKPVSDTLEEIDSSYGAGEVEDFVR